MAVFGLAGLLAVLATVMFAMLRPPTLLRPAVVIPPQPVRIYAEADTAASDPALLAVNRSYPFVALEPLPRRVHYASVVVAGRTLLFVTVMGGTAADAQSDGNSVARTYEAVMGEPGALGGQVPGRYEGAVWTSEAAWIAETAVFGTLVGLALGVIGALTLIRPRIPGT